MSIPELLDKYGYIAVFVGTTLEGETILILAGFAAHQGYLSLPWVMGTAFLGSLFGDQAAFYVGRHYGTRVLTRFPRLGEGVTRARALLRRHEVPLLIGFRFIYGIRTVTPIAVGLSDISVKRFAPLNAIGAAVWAVAIAAAGYAFGRGFSLVLERARRYEHFAIIVLLAIGVSIALVSHYLRTRKKQG